MRRTLPSVLGLAISLAAVGSAGLTASPAAADGDDKPTEVGIEIKGFGGDGCTKDDTFVRAEPDVVSLVFSTFEARAAGAGKTATSSCRVVFRLIYPAGFTYTVVNSDYRGYVELADGASADHATTYQFENSNHPTTARQTWNGPASKTFNYRDAQSRQVWAPCGAKEYLMVNNTLTARGAADADSYISMDSHDTEVRGAALFNLKWAKC